MWLHHCSMLILILWVYMEEWNNRVKWWVHSKFSEKSPYCFPEWLYQIATPPAMYEYAFFPKSMPTSIIVCVLDKSHSNWRKMKS